VEYEAIESIPLRTATNFTTIIGKGTVILYVNKKAVRLSPVYVSVAPPQRRPIGP
jgi:hypothetical protein